MRLKDKVAIVTGAGRGLGKGIAKKLAEEGAKVVLADMNSPDEAVAEITAGGGTASAFTVNVTKQEEMQKRCRLRR
ncbi:SDR family NAD(P)-dependent oxidoreductase [Muricomes intestini]|uniref:SDR family NAD(P)-dependent oxidoreductase n=1 Tax=Muricomes intestini TaxID=1796634 RepID=UPI002FDB8ED3